MIIFLMSGICYGQTTTLQEYTTQSGHLFITGQSMQLGMGSGTNHDFVFIYTSPNSLAGKIYLGSSWTGNAMEIKSIKMLEAKKTGKKVYLVCSIGAMTNYWCDIEAAILTGEVVVK